MKKDFQTKIIFRERKRYFHKYIWSLGVISKISSKIPSYTTQIKFG